MRFGIEPLGAGAPTGLSFKGADFGEKGLADAPVFIGDSVDEGDVELFDEAIGKELDELVAGGAAFGDEEKTCGLFVESVDEVAIRAKGFEALIVCANPAGGLIDDEQMLVFKNGLKLIGRGMRNRLPSGREFDKRPFLDVGCPETLNAPIDAAEIGVENAPKSLAGWGRV